MFKKRSLSQSGNVVLALFGALGLLGAVGYGYSTLIKGPAQGVQNITSRTTSETNIFAAAKMIAAASKETQASGGDCDGDTMVEPFQWRAAGGLPSPAGGGLIPTNSSNSLVPASVPSKDSWGTDFGYCTWDHGTVTVTNNVAACGGSSALRLRGGNVKSEYAIALISAGADKQFQTTCSHFVNTTTPLLTKAAGSDDIFVAWTYAEAFEASGTGADLSDIDDAACTVDSIGLLRYEMEVLQVCMSDGAGGAYWQEVGSEAETAPGFNPMSGVERSTVYTSNNASFTGFFGTRLATVDNGATLVVNGVAQGQSAQISTTDSVAVRATSAATFSTARTFTVKISSITRTWVLTTRPPTPPVFTVSPNPRTGMNVAGTTGTAYGSAVTFTVTNTGEATSSGINTIAFAPSTNFEVTGTNNCTGNTLAGGATCTFQVRPRATQPGAISTTMTISATGATSATDTLSGNATGWPCTQLAWAGSIANPGGSVTAYQYSTAATCNGACPSETRSCSGSASLSGSWTNQSCDALAVCTYSWQTGGWGSCSVSCGGGTQTRTVWCRRSDGTTVADGPCGGGKPAASQSCNTGACPDTTPNAFSFTDQSDVDKSTNINSNIRQVTGINVPTAVSISPSSADYRICSNSSCSSVVAGWNNTVRNIDNGEYIQIRRTSSGSNNTTSNTTLTVGTYTVPTWQITTIDCSVDGPRYHGTNYHFYEEPGTSEGECGCTRVVWGGTTIQNINGWSIPSYTEGGWTYTRGALKYHDQTGGGRDTNKYEISRVKSACP